MCPFPIAPAVRKDKLEKELDRQNAISEDIARQRETNVTVSQFIHWVGRNRGLSDTLLNEYKDDWLETL